MLVELYKEETNNDSVNQWRWCANIKDGGSTVPVSINYPSSICETEIIIIKKLITNLKLVWETLRAREHA